MPTLKDVAEYLGLQSERQMASKLGLQPPISTLALIKKYEQLPPKARFSVFPSSGTMPLTVQFTDESLGYITKWDWKFDDGETSHDRSPSHKYGKPKEEFTGNAFELLGCYAWSPTVTVSNKGGSDTAPAASVTVNPAPPMAKFQAPYPDHEHPLTWYFGVDLSSGHCLTHQWDFGDSASGDKNHATTSGQEGTQHTYSGPGSYNVMLTVSNSAGTSTAGMTITVTGGSGSGSDTPPPGDTPYIMAGRDSAYPSTLQINGGRFSAGAQINITVIKESDGGLLASVYVYAGTAGTFDKTPVSVTGCVDTGSTPYTIDVTATQVDNNATSNTMKITCWAAKSP